MVICLNRAGILYYRAVYNKGDEVVGLHNTSSVPKRCYRFLWTTSPAYASLLDRLFLQSLSRIRQEYLYRKGYGGMFFGWDCVFKLAVLGVSTGRCIAGLPWRIFMMGFDTAVSPRY